VTGLVVGHGPVEIEAKGVDRFREPMSTGFIARNEMVGRSAVTGLCGPRVALHQGYRERVFLEVCTSVRRVGRQGNKQRYHPCGDVGAADPT
jgi:hypothetical protein